MSPQFQVRVDQRLAALECCPSTAGIGRMRRIPIDVIAAAVEREGLQVPSVTWRRRLWLWITRTSLSAVAIDNALLAVAKRNGFA